MLMKTFLQFCFQPSLVLLLLAPFFAVSRTGFAPFFSSDAVRLAIGKNLRPDTADSCVQNGLFQLAFPNDDDAPALGLQLPPGLMVAFLVPCDLRRPEVRVGLGNRVVLAPLVAMPETAVNKDDSVVFGKDDVGGAGEKFIVYSIAEPLMPENIAKGPLRTSILGSVM